jgi:hypothetical protein
MQREVAVEIERAVRARRLRGRGDADLLPVLVIIGIAVGHHHRKPIDRAALENADKHLVVVGGRGAEIGRHRRLTKETGTEKRTRARTDEGEGALLEKDAAIDVHGFIFFGTRASRG